MSNLNLKDLFDQTDRSAALTCLTKHHDYLEECTPYGLGFGDLWHLIDAYYSIGLEGMNVLEFGGQLDPTFIKICLRPASWCSITLDLYNSDYHFDERSLVRDGIFVTTVDSDFPYYYSNLGLQAIYQSNSFFSNSAKFNRVISIAAFEHLRQPILCLDQLHSLCTPNALIYSYFTPTWSAPNGHHWSYASAPIPEYSHLYFSHEEMLSYLLLKQGPNSSIILAERDAHFIYKSTRINRLLPSEWEFTFRTMPFGLLEKTSISEISIESLSANMSHKRISILKDQLRSDSACSGYRLILAK